MGREQCHPAFRRGLRLYEPLLVCCQLPVAVQRHQLQRRRIGGSPSHRERAQPADVTMTALCVPFRTELALYSSGRGRDASQTCDSLACCYAKGPWGIWVPDPQP